MSPAIACLIILAGIAGLLWLDRNPKARCSWALWVPVLWIAIACSRPVSLWFQTGTDMDSTGAVLDGSPVDRLVYSVLLAAGLLVLAGRGAQVGKILLSNWAILLFLFYCTMSIGWSDYPAVAFKRWTKAVGDLVMILIVLSDRDPINAVKRVLARMAYVLIPLSVLFIKYYRTIGVGYSIWGGTRAFYTGVTTNKNTLGVVCLILGLGALWRILLGGRDQEGPALKRRIIPQLVILAMVGWLFSIIDAKTSLSSFVMASVLLFAATSKFVIRRPWIVHLLVLVMVAASASVLFLGVSPGALEMMGRNPTLTDRTEVWGVLLTLVGNPLLGTGFESFWLGSRLERMWDLYWWHPNEAHNGYLEIYLNLGWIGIILLALVLVAAYWTVYSAWRKEPRLGNLRLAYFFVGMVFNFTEAAFFRIQAPAWLFFLLAIVSVPVVTLSRTGAPRNGARRSDPAAGWWRGESNSDGRTGLRSPVQV